MTLQYLLGSSEKEAEETFLKFEKLLNKIANSYSIYSKMEKNDLFGQAILGLATAKHGYNPEKGNFINYAIRVIQDELNEYIRINMYGISIPSYIMKTHKIIENIKTLLNNNNIKYDPLTLSAEQIPKNISQKYNDYMEKLNNAADRAGISSKVMIERAEFLPVVSSELEIEEESNTNQTYKDIVMEIKKIMTDEEWIISKGIMEGKNYEEIGKELNLSAPRVSQIFSSLKKKIKDKYGEDLLNGI